MSDFDTFTANYERQRQAADKANALNKAIILDALSAAGITDITATFDGEGDSGQIEDIIAYAGEALTALPGTPITLHQAQWNSDDLGLYESTLHDAIETLCYDYLAQEHGGWENNEGAYGEFQFDVAARTIHLDFHARFIDDVHSRHEF